MISDDSPINFQSVARRAKVSTDFLYNDPALRARIEQLRRNSQPRNPGPQVAPESHDKPTSGAVRALTHQLKQMRVRHHQEVTQLREALAAAHGENLELRRALDHTQLHRPRLPQSQADQ